MDFRKLITRYQQFGGIQLVIEYAKLGILWPAVKLGVRCLVKGQSFKAIYPEVLKRVEPILIKRYESLMRCKKEEVRSKNPEHQLRKIVWFCWLQGIQNAPTIVKACYNSLERHLVQGEGLKVKGFEIKVIDNENWKEYVELPE